MIKLLTFIAFAITISFHSTSQNDFQAAYANNPNLPNGILEAVAWNNTRMVHFENIQEGCAGIPVPYGIMGLFDYGKNYFIKNGVKVAHLSGISVTDQKASAANQIMAFAIAFNIEYQNQLTLGATNGKAIRQALHSLSQIPEEGIVNQLCRDIQVYDVLRFMNSVEKANQYNFTVSNFDLQTIFGADNYAVLSSKKIRFTNSQILSDHNQAYAVQNLTKSTEYGPAIWNPTPTCNYSSRSGTAISAIAIHTAQGSYSSTISWAQNCSSNVSYHYVVKSSDGQITQMLLEADKGWHIGSENPYTIGYEHEGYVDQTGWYTTAMYESSADLSRDICNSGYGIPPLRTYYGVATVGTLTLGACTKIKGHQHYPNQTHTDPGINWDWERYYRLINNNTPITTISATSGSFYDTGGSAGNYSNDERELWLFTAPGATSVTLNFSSFDTELDYDRMFIYDGDTIGAPLIGEYMGTNSPGTVTSTGGSLLVEFRSDCGTTLSGWNATYSISVTPPPAPSNDECSGAIALTVNADTLCGTTTSGTLYGATASTVNTGSCSGIENDDVWFSFVASGTEHTLKLQNITGSTSSLSHSIWTGSCSSLNFETGMCFSNTSNLLSGLTIGTTYFVRVNSTTGNNETTTFDVCVGTPPAPPAPVDSIPPTTLITSGSTWQTTDFLVDFTDNDNESGVEKSYYLIAQKNQLANDWIANGNNRFAYESFEDNAANWFPVTGTFAINSGVFQFLDIAEQNSNTYMNVTQNSSETYLYEWDQTITSSDVNQRAGLHFFCDNPNLSNRGNSYFVYLRENDNAVEIFSVNSNVINSEVYTPYTINANQTYNCKVTYNPSTGWIKVYVNNEFVSEWQDTTPLTSGGFISLRSGGCAVNFDDVKVYHSRTNQVNVSLSSEMTIQSENAVASGYIETVVIDSADNWSVPSYATYLIDTTPPTMTILNDGSATDIDTFYVTTLEANWSMDDIHSSISGYEVAVGTAAGLSDVVTWTNNSLSTIYSSILSSPVYDQVYFVSVRATNNAGLMAEYSSNGQRYLQDVSGLKENSPLKELILYPNPSANFIQFKNAPSQFHLVIVDEKGRICQENDVKGLDKVNVSKLEKGHYNVLMQSGNQFIIRTLIIN